MQESANFYSQAVVRHFSSKGRTRVRNEETIISPKERQFHYFQDRSSIALLRERERELRGKKEQGRSEGEGFVVRKHGRDETRKAVKLR